MRLAADWLSARPTKAVFAVLARGGYGVRAVGGVVRNTLLGLPVTDIDLATDATPGEVVRLAGVAGFKTIPTGISHGTVTVIALGQPFEITTLRHDVATDGRHAEVAFTTDWAADARRRDFTINAFYCNADGALFDPLGGVADLDPVRVRFIGEPAARIAEDYLRILRFFRFTAVYTADGALDADGLAACTHLRAGLGQISGERIQVELYKLLAARHAGPVTAALVESLVFAALLDVQPHMGDLARLIAIEERLGFAPDCLRRLATLAVAAPADVAVLDRRLKFSGQDRQRMTCIAAQSGWDLPAFDEAQLRRLGYTMGTAAYQDAALAGWARSGARVDDSGWTNAVTLAQRFTPPVFPISGRDLVALGYAPGPLIGEVLDGLEADWIAGAFQPGRDGLLELARKLLADSKS